MFGYWLVFLISFAESLAFVGALVPGAVLVALAGFLSAQGYLDLGDLLWFAAGGAMLGDGISYWLGTKGTEFFRIENKILKRSHLEKGERFFKEHGNKSIFFGRFIGPIRPIIPFVAGLSKMNKWAFLFWNIVSAFLWAAALLLAGYFFGGAISAITVWSTRVSIFLFALFVLLVILWLLVKKSAPFFRFLKSIFLSMKESVIANRDLQNFVKTHPLFFSFLGRRLEKSAFSGLPLTVLSLALLYIIVLFLGVVQDILSSDLIVAADIRVSNLLFAFRDAKLIAIFLWITLLAKWQIAGSAAIVVSVLCWMWKKRIYIAPLWMTMIGSALFIFFGKLITHRPRPETAYYSENSFSFPSGHSTLAVALYGFIAYILFREIQQWKYKTTALFTSIGIIFAVGLSRLYLGEHFLSDVWGGYLLGLMWLIIGMSVAEWLIRKKMTVQAVRTSTKIKIVSALFIIAELAFYAHFAIQYNPPLAAPKEIKTSVIDKDIFSLFQDKKLPRATETLIGASQEPLSFVMIAKDDSRLIGVLEKAGWYLADPATFASVERLAASAFLNRSYLAAPMTPSFWNAKVHDLGFEKQTEAQSVRERHHARFWRTDFFTQNGDRIYFGTASLDMGIKWGITHKIKPDIDTEREFLFSDLEQTGAVARFEKMQFVEPILGKNFSGDQFFTDGKLYIVY